MKIEELGLSTHAYNSLHTANISSVSQLLEYTGEGLLSIPNLGNTILNEIKSKLWFKFGKELKSPVSETVQQEGEVESQRGSSTYVSTGQGVVQLVSHATDIDGIFSQFIQDLVEPISGDTEPEKMVIDVTSMIVAGEFVTKKVDDRIEELGFSTRTYNRLNSENITLVSQLLEYTEERLLSIPNLGEVALNEIKSKLLEKVGKELKPPEALDENDLRRLQLTPAAYKALIDVGIKNLDDLILSTRDQILKIEGIAESRLSYIERNLAQLGKSLKPE